MTTTAVDLVAGRAVGTALDSGVRRFWSLPYAEPPTGPGRFAEPVSVRPWTGVRDATRPGPTAPQPDRSHFGSLDLTAFFAPGWVHGDDHLTVSVWAPPTGSEPAPVLVFVHGGAFVAGSPQAPAYDGERLAQSGVLVVGVQYRLGITGFLTLPGFPDNRGLLDVIEALRWVEANAAALGGDPSRVTLAGQSAGAVLVGCVLTDERAAGLAARAIVQSGSGTARLTSEQAELVGAAVAERSGLTLEGLVEADDESLIKVAASLGDLDLDTPQAPAPIGGIVRFGPVLDTAPAQNLGDSWGGGVALLTGANLDEAGLYLAPLPDHATPTDADVAAAAARVRIPALGGESSYERLRATLSEGMFRAGTRSLATAHAAAGRAPTFYYDFTWRSDAYDGRLGACHLLELPFVFANATIERLHGPSSLLGTTGPPEALAAQVHQSWLTFIRGGDPWPPVSSQDLTPHDLGGPRQRSAHPTTRSGKAPSSG